MVFTRRRGPRRGTTWGCSSVTRRVQWGAVSAPSTRTRNAVRWAADADAEALAAHHPAPFRPLRRITPGALAAVSVWDAACHGIAVYAAHTNVDAHPRPARWPPLSACERRHHRASRGAIPSTIWCRMRWRGTPTCCVRPWAGGAGHAGHYSVRSAPLAGGGARPATDAPRGRSRFMAAKDDAVA